MNIDFDKSHPAMNMDDKVNLYKGVLRWTGVCIVLTALLMLFLLVFYTN